MNDKINFLTKSVHAGEKKLKDKDSLTNPIYQTSTYVFKNTNDLCEYMDKKKVREEYGRYGNPTVEVAQNKLAELDNGKWSLLFSSGMTAICVTLFTLLEKNSHIIITSDSYRRTRQFVTEILPKFGIDYSVVAPNISNIENNIKSNTEIIISESPTNPYLRVLDIPKIVDIAKKHSIITIIDSTLASPYNQRPIEMGIDLVFHSATKYLGGHNDLLAGTVIGNSDLLLDQIKQYRDIMGGIPDPQTAYLLIRGLKTFALRLKQQNQSALKLAEFLESHPKVNRVHYPGLKSHTDYNIAKEQLSGFGGLMSFEINGDIKKTSNFIDMIKIPLIAPSLGGVETLIEQVSLVSYYDLTREERLKLGIKDNLVRLAVGIENVDDLISDIDNALNKI